MMLKHCQSLSSESRGGGPQTCSPPPLPPRFALCTDTISLSSSSSRSSSPAISDILVETNFPSIAPNISTQKCSPTSPQRRIKKPFLPKPLLTPKTPSLKEAASSQKSSMLGGRSCSFLASNARVEQDKDRGSPVLVQCRWFDSPVPSLDKHEVELERKPSKVRHSVHFGEEDDGNCDQDHSEDRIKTKEEESNKVIKDEEKPTSCTNTVPIIKVAKVTQLNCTQTEVDTNNNEKTVPVMGGLGVTLKVYARCLAPDIEYKTVIVSENMTTRDLVWLLLSKCRMKHRDPKLFYLTMDVTVKKTGIPIKRTMVLDDDARPAQLRSCNPWGECKFSMQMKKGGLVAELKYKCLLISDDTTVEDVIRILLNCYGYDKMEEISRFCIYESGDFRERKLNKNEKPLSVQSHWSSSSHYQRFILRRATRSVSNQFPEETCVDDNDRELSARRFKLTTGTRSLYWSGYSTTDSEDSTCDGEVENTFQPINVPPVSRQSNSRLLECLFTPTPVPLSQLMTGTASQELSLFTSLPALLDGRPISVLDSVDRIGAEMRVNIINRPYIGSLSNSVGSDIPSEQSGEHFFYI